MIFTFGNCGKNRGRYHYLLHIVRLFFIFTDLHWSKNVLGLRPRTFLPNCKSVKIEKSLTIYTIYVLIVLGAGSQSGQVPWELQYNSVRYKHFS